MERETLLRMLLALSRGEQPSGITALISAPRSRPGGLGRHIDKRTCREGITLIFGVNGRTRQMRGVGNPAALRAAVLLQCAELCPDTRPSLIQAKMDSRTFVCLHMPPLDIHAHQKMLAADTGASPLARRVRRRRLAKEGRVTGAPSARELDRLVMTEPVPEADRGEIDLEGAARLASGCPDWADALSGPCGQRLGAAGDGSAVPPAFMELLLFGRNPQQYFPKLGISITFKNRGAGETVFIGGPVPAMLRDAEACLAERLAPRVLVHPRTGRQAEEPLYPREVLREALLNAVLHRNYLLRATDVPISVVVDDRTLSVSSPAPNFNPALLENDGSRRKLVWPNHLLMTAASFLNLAAGRHSGIPMMRRVMRDHLLFWPVFRSHYGCCRILLHSRRVDDAAPAGDSVTDRMAALLAYCRTPRTRAEIMAFLGCKNLTHLHRVYTAPLLAQKLLRETQPESPRSRTQTYVTASDVCGAAREDGDD
ncbi:MAG: hypothetical protein Q4F72_05780 [Desulfovibrionaceae bacterium]|nr:hypothetical protein [Desulfovibrionaceae bacterium]